MSYFYKNKVYNYYQVIDQCIGSDKITKDVIEIINNEKILFDFSNLVVHSKSAGVLNFSDVETIKIYVDWGDGFVDRISKPLISNKSTIGVYRPNQWKVIEHLFNVQKRYEYVTDDVDSLHKITITAYNSFNDKFVITIPYKMVYKTLYDLGSEISLFSSNTTNNNKVSYTLKQASTDSMIVVMTKDWKSIYGEDEVEIIDKKKVAKDFSDDFADIDNMVWDWKSVPTVNLTVKHSLPSSSNAQKGLIECSFVETGVSVDKWEGSVVFPKDTGDTYPAIETDYENFKFKTTKALFPGVYAISINPILGINGVKGSSEIKYINFNRNARPRELREPASKSVIDNSNANQIKINYTLKTYQQLKNITKIELLLSAHYKKYKDVSIDDVRFSYDLLKPLLDNNGNPLYVKKTPQNINFEFIIPKRNIPHQHYYQADEDDTPVLEDIEYDVQIVTNDVLGGEDNTTFYTNEGNVKELTPISFTYNIGNFETATVQSQNQVDKTVNLDWKFKTTDVWDEFKVQLKNNATGNLIYDDTHEYANDNKFNGLTTTVSNNVISNFRKTFDGNKIPDGAYTITITYNVHMADYYETRSETKTVTGNFAYKKPALTINDIRPYTKVNYDAIRDKQNLSLCCEIISTYNAEPLKNITMTIDNTDVYALSEVGYVYNFDKITAHKKTFKLSAANANDIYNRNGSVSKEFSITNNLSSLLTLPLNGVDYLETDFNKVFEVVGEEDKVVDMLWIKENTLHDVRKSHKYTSNGVEYFGCADRGKFKFGDSARYALYEIISLKTGDKTYRRFIPYKGSTTNFGNGTALSAANTLVVPTHTTDYQTMVDLGKIIFDWSTSNSNLFSNLEKIKNMWLKVYDSEGNLIVQDTIIGQKHKTIENLNFGTYKYEIELHSEYNATDSCLTTQKTIDLKVPAAKSVVHTINQPIVSEASNGKKYLLWRWKVNHKSATEIIFCYETDKGETGTFTQAKLQEEYEPNPLTEGAVVNYWFKVKSPYIDGTPDADGYVEVNRKTFTIPKSST